MGDERCCGDEEEEELHLLLVPEEVLIQILVWLPVVSLLRFKSVSKSWFALIETSYFIHLHTVATTTTSSKFGSFVVQAAVNFRRFREDALVMLSSSSESESSECRVLSSNRPGYSRGWWYNGSDGVCGRCVTGSEPGSDWLVDTRSNGLCVKCGQWSCYSVAEDDDHVFKLDNSYLAGTEGGGGGGSSNDQQQQQQQLVFKLDTFGFPSTYNFGKIKPILMVGSCNGLVCLLDKSNNNWGDISLWNPATRQFRILPESITNDGDYPIPKSAFGFDAETKDYKVVLVSVRRIEARSYHPCRGVQSSRSDKCSYNPCRVQVYSLRSDSWRLLEGITCLPSYAFFDPSMGLYLNGNTCFFIARFPCSGWYPKFRFIISFDLTKEKIIPIRLPEHHSLSEKLYLCYLGDKITLFTASRYLNGGGIGGDDEDTTGGYEYFNIWVLNEHGSRSSSCENKKFWTKMNYGSWTKVRSFQIQCKMPGKCHTPIGISNDGEFALLETREGNAGYGRKLMKLYNLVTKEVKKNFLSCDQLLSAAYAYQPSLVSVIGGGNGCNNSNS